MPKKVIISVQKNPQTNVRTITIVEENFHDFIRLVTEGGKAMGLEVLVEESEDFLP